jgi:signal transduction histidine kinase
MRDEEIQATSEYLKETNEQLIEKQEIILLQAEDLMEANLKLKETDAAKDKFFSIIAHDLRGPFGAFMGLTEIMAEESSSYTIDEIHEFSVDMRKSASNLYRLLENLLQWAKMQQGTVAFNPELIQLHPVIDECINVAKESAKSKGIEIGYDLPDDLTVFADSNMLQTIIRNLVSNAMKFTPKGGKISVSAKANGDKIIEIAVKDTGIGMTSEMVSNLFRLDVKTNRKGTEGEPSSGLGLLLCKEFVEKLGGRIWVESEEGKGSEFKFTLPDGN